MENFTFDDGIEPGGLRSRNEIKVLVCYLLAGVDERITRSQLCEIALDKGLANYFEVNDSIAYLCKSGQLEVFNEEEDTYVITKSGRDIAQTLKTTLPFSVKDRAFTAALKMVSRFRNSKETDIKISREGDKTFITCSAIDNGDPFMSVKLMVTDEEQALFIKERFINDPSRIYSEIIELLTKEVN